VARGSGPWGVIGWLAAPDNTLAGAAFLIGSGIAVTCAHVVRDHLGLPNPTPPELPHARVIIRFEALGIEVGGRVIANGWFPDAVRDPDGISDVAIIRLERQIDDAAIPAIARAMPNQRFPAFVYGAEPGYERIGQETQVKISGNPNPKGWLPLESPPTGFAIKRGFSGAPAMDELGNTVWGMIAAVDAGGERVSFAIPADDLHRALHRVGAASAAGVRIEDEADIDARNAMIALTERLAGMELEAERRQAEMERLRETVRGFEQRERDTAETGPDRRALQSLAQGDTRPATDILREQVQSRRREAAAVSRQLGSLLSLTNSVEALAAYREAASLDPEDFWTWIEVGNREILAGSLTHATEAFRCAQERAARLNETDPHNTGWQRDLSVSHNRIGDIRRAQGDLAGALDAYNKGLEIRARLAETDKHNTEWQRDLSVSHNKIGNVRLVQGDLASALDAYNKHLEIATRLAATDPDNTMWQRDLSVSHIKIGNLREEQKDPLGALDAYNKGLEIAARLAETDPHNTQWQRDLSVIYTNIGDAHELQRDPSGARDAYNKSLKIAARLVETDPDNTEWQRDLSIIHHNIGNVLRAQSDLSGALDAYNKGLEIRARLAETDPHNTQWQRDLSISHKMIGSVLRAQGNLSGALDAYNKDLEIAARLAETDPHNTQWQRDLSISHEMIGGVLRAQGNLSGALDAYNKDLEIAARLAALDSSNAQWQEDLTISRRLVAQITEQIRRKE
jgi:tetratricopeptide (TPR) repeat protein